MKTKIFQNWLNLSSNKLTQGANFGHKSLKLQKTQYWHPLMSNYFLGFRDNISIFNSQQTIKCLLRAYHVIALLLKQKGRILIINTNPEFFRLCENFIDLALMNQDFKSLKQIKSNTISENKIFETKIPLISYVNYKWIGGTLTNWKQVSKSVLTFAKFSERCEKFLIQNDLDFPKYTRVKKSFQGLIYRQNSSNLLAFKQKPDLIIIMNPNENQGILNEAYRLHIPIIAFTESNTNPNRITYPIPVNNSSIKFIYYCLKKISKITHI